MKRNEIEIADVEIVTADHPKDRPSEQRADRTAYLVVPFLFLIVTLLGGMRLAQSDNSFVFLPPELITLVLAGLTLVLVFRAEVLSFFGWFRDADPMLKKAANVAILLTLFAATSQIYNSLLPEKGLLHWLFVFCFFWAIATNLLAEMPARKVIASFGTLFGIAFIAKYIVLASLASPADISWLQRIWENPGREAIALVIGKPEFSPSSGYIHFVAIALYLAGLYLLPKRI
ncbi:MAG: hypothetical protein IPM50_13150 [Acidobacteriota bacterium]|nr:MAG: hypothetical protein IPM50_13150 [Acidobacteriota bacterium]